MQLRIAFWENLKHTMLPAISCLAVLAFLTHSPSDRQLYSERARELTHGMSMADAISLVGEPSAIMKRDESTPHFWFSDRDLRPRPSQSIFLYGATDEEPFPTLLHLHFDESNRLLWSDSTRSQAISQTNIPDSLSEAEIKQGLRYIHKWECGLGKRFNPRIAINAANALIEFDKAEIVALMEEYLRLAPDTYSAQFCLTALSRVIFELPRGWRHPHQNLGVPQPSRGMGFVRYRVVPTFPVVLIGDVPVLLAISFTANGEPRVYDEFDFYREYGTVRQEKLRPSIEPHRIPEAVEERYPELFADRSGYRIFALVIVQSIRLVDDKYSYTGDLNSFFSKHRREYIDGMWEEPRAQIRNLNLIWDGTGFDRRD